MRKHLLFLWGEWTAKQLFLWLKGLVFLVPSGKGLDCKGGNDAIY